MILKNAITDLPLAAFLLKPFVSVKGLIYWRARKFNSPSPHFIKQACVIRNGFPNATWIETGTYLGQTTTLLAKIGRVVYSIEPEPTLFLNAKKKFSKCNNVKILNSTSENAFSSLLPKLKGNVNFWLDGHYSGGLTFKGQKDTPIIDELRNIEENYGLYDKTCVMIDDIRCFNPKIAEYSEYPDLNFLVDWANRNNFDWHIEHDIFIIKKE